MTTAANLRGVEFGHERNGFALLRHNFLEALFEHDVHIGHRDGFVIDKVHFMLSPAPFAFAGFHRHSRRGHHVPDGAHDRFVPCRLHRVIIDPIIARGSQIPVIGNERVVVSVVE